MTEDETTDPENASNAPKPLPIPGKAAAPTAPTLSNEPEPVILEEHVIKAAGPSTKPAPPAPDISSSREGKPIPPIVVPHPDPNFKPSIPAETPAAEPKVAPMSPLETRGPAATGAPATPSAETDFTHILKTIKLPERRDFKASADTKPVPPVMPPAQQEKTSTTDMPAIPAIEPDEPASSIVTPLRTLKDDLQSIIREQKISLVHAATLEEEKKQGQEHLAPEQREINARRSRRAIGIIFVSILLFLLGGAALYGVFFVMQEQQAVPTVQQSSILFAEQTDAFSLDNQTPEDLKAALAQASDRQLGSLGSITRILPTILSTTTSGQSEEQAATISQFFSALGMNPPQELVGAIGPNFFLGFHVVDTNAPLLVIPVTSYDHAFAGMLAWEATMDSDLAPVFTLVPMTRTATSGVPVERTFQDAVMRNYDVRELLDDSGNIVLYYSFPTPNILVIAESPYSFTEILSRLQAQGEL